MKRALVAAMLALADDYRLRLRMAPAVHIRDIEQRAAALHVQQGSQT